MVFTQSFHVLVRRLFYPMPTGLLLRFTTSGPSNVETQSVEETADLQKLQVSVNMYDAVYVVRFKEQYVNKHPTPVEAIYRFRLADERSYLSNFEATVGERRLVTKHVPQLLDGNVLGPRNIPMQSRLTSEPVGTLLVNLGEIAPNDECVVVVEYTTQVTTTATGSMLMKVPYDVFPTRARGISPGLSIPVSMSFDVLMRVPGGIANVVCYYYDITHDLTKSEDVVRCKCVMDGKPLTSDFEIEVTSTQPLRTHWFVQQDNRYAALFGASVSCFQQAGTTQVTLAMVPYASMCHVHTCSIVCAMFVIANE